MINNQDWNHNKNLQEEIIHNTFVLRGMGGLIEDKNDKVHVDSNSI